MPDNEHQLPMSAPAVTEAISTVLVVVHTDDAVLVASLERSQDVKLLRERLEALGLDHLL